MSGEKDLYETVEETGVFGWVGAVVFAHLGAGFLSFSAGCIVLRFLSTARTPLRAL